MEKRLILATILSMAVIFLTQLLFFKKAEPVPAPAGTQTSAPATPEKPAPATASATPAPPATPAPVETAPANDIPATRAEHLTTKVETPLYTAVLDNQGGVLRSFTLKEYDDQGRHWEMMADVLPANMGAFLSWAVPGDEELEKTLNSSCFEVSRTPAGSSGGKGEQVRFTFQHPRFQAEKTIEFISDKPYLLRVTARVKKTGADTSAYLVLGPGLTRNDLVALSGYQLAPQILYSAGQDRNVLEAKKINDGQAGQQRIDSPMSWCGLETKFFAALVIPSRTYTHALGRNQLWRFQDPKDSKAAPQDVHIPSLLVPLQESPAVDLFVGPKSLEVLSSIREDLSNVIDYGWFSIIVRPLYYALRWVQQYVVNWGFSIIVLTFLITLAMFPLRISQIKSMRKMQHLQPKMKAIQAKYKGQKTAEARQKMNMETMQLYKEAGVNPAMGCLPLLMQMPFLIAFYNLIDKSVDMWHQPFIFWIKDLTISDPYYITPVMMGASMLIQMKQNPTPTTQDNRLQQQMMTWLMPIMFTFMFMGAASGLVIYFLFSNLFGWGMQKAFEAMTGNGAGAAETKTAGKKK